MKRFLFLLFVWLLIMPACADENVNNCSLYGKNACLSIETEESRLIPIRCKTIEYNCFGPTAGKSKFVYNCTECQPGYKLVDNAIDVNGCGNSYLAQDCVEACNEQTNCVSDATWTSVETGYQKRVVRSCLNDDQCTATTEYRCDAGFYGRNVTWRPNLSTGKITYSGCSRCPYQIDNRGDFVVVGPAQSGLTSAGTNNRSAVTQATTGIELPSDIPSATIDLFCRQQGLVCAHSVAGDNKTINTCYATVGSDDTGSYSFESACYYSE